MIEVLEILLVGALASTFTILCWIGTILERIADNQLYVIRRSERTESDRCSDGCCPDPSKGRGTCAEPQ